MNGEVNRSSIDRGQGWEGFERLAKLKLDQCLAYKINVVWFDGFGPGLGKRALEYPAVMRRLNACARERGIRLVFGTYGASYGFAFQMGPLYEDAPYLGEVFVNRESYPDGPVRWAGRVARHRISMTGSLGSPRAFVRAAWKTGCTGSPARNGTAHALAPGHPPETGRLRQTDGDHGRERR